MDIEKLFQEKFSTFEGEVSPDAWANIQQGMNAAGSGSAASAGMTTLMKTVLVSGGLVAATFGGIYLFSEDEKSAEESDSPIVQVNTVEPEITVATDVETNGLVENNSENETIDATEVLHAESNQNSQVEANQEGNQEQESSVNEETGNGTGDSSTDGNTSNGDNTTSDKGTETESGNNATSTGTEKEDNTQDSSVKEPKANLTFEPGDLYAPSTYTFHANATNYDEVLWDFGNGETATGADVRYTFEKPGSYVVKMTVKGKGKDVVETQEVTIQATSSIDRVPNAFTPNGDHKNDFFMIFMTEIETFAITIRGQQGEVIFQSTDPDFRWYGTYPSGERVENGTYTYEFFARGTDGSEFPKSGTIRVED